MKYINILKRKGVLRCVIYTVLFPFYLVLFSIFSILFKIVKPRKDYIIFKSYPDYSDNSRVLYEYMEKNGFAKKYIWLIDKNTNKEKLQHMNKKNNTLFVYDSSKYHKGLSIRALYYLNKSSMIFYTHGSVIGNYKHKKNQLIINLWHGCGYKKGSKHSNGKKWIENNYFDYVLVPGKVFIKTKSDSFGCKEDQVLPLGYPRYNLLQNNNIKTEQYVKRIASNNLLIIWMPTFRITNYIEDNKNYFPEEKEYINSDLPLINSKEELNELNEICKSKKITLCIKRHPNQKKYRCESERYSNIIFIDNKTLEEEKIDLYSLLRYTNGLITDYSSVAIDYILLDKPIAFTLEDFEKYSKSRGFVFKDPKKYMPGHHIYNFDDLKKYLNDVSNNRDIHLDDRHIIMDEVHNPCDDYCKRIIDELNILLKK